MPAKEADALNALVCPHDVQRRCHLVKVLQCTKVSVCMRVLIVEDDLQYARLLGIHLAKSFPSMGRTVKTTIQDALHEVHSNTYDLIFLDVRLPDAIDTSGLRLLLRAADGVPIIVMTGYTSQGAPEFLELGAQAYLLKQDATREVIAGVTRKALGLPHE